MQVVRVGDPLTQFEIFVPRGGATAFRLDLREPDGSPTVVTGPVVLTYDNTVYGESTPGSWTGVYSRTWVKDGLQVRATTPGAVATSSVTFTVRPADTVNLAFGQRRCTIVYTPRGEGPTVLGRAILVIQ